MKKALIFSNDGFSGQLYRTDFERGCAEGRQFAISSKRAVEEGGLSLVHDELDFNVGIEPLERMITYLQNLKNRKTGS